eukprot:CAMPEP_0175814274 /NCGR_PEP_ID=MMETSP0107_2-20121207/5329_1 /TAXON_ID=195067 ORGANISM="Goniomonas pacifica, Strain CCMP1869" /NCGR_SAMPLE_ID=MMETSP0107_2 /ASSEMBLY_ACC=CAM_ASM_000203 /LENGTH=38 /DNA_ID= /DNA_START= /DNA_END= /DNA_ORIENTATION=
MCNGPSEAEEFGGSVRHMDRVVVARKSSEFSAKRSRYV